MSVSSPAPPRWLRTAALIIGLAVFIWLPIEDKSETSALALALAIGVWLGLRTLLPLSVKNCHCIWIRYPLLSATIGMAVPIFTALLMVFKSGLHGHGFPDYSMAQFQRIFQSIPILAGSGLLIGLAAALWRSQECP